MVPCLSIGRHEIHRSDAVQLATIERADGFYRGGVTLPVDPGTPEVAGDR
jgi:hypothetical protein